MKEKIQSIVVVLIVLLLLFGLGSIIFGGCEDNGGDGKSSCKNCGRSSVYASGFCKRCYESYIDYLNERY